MRQRLGFSAILLVVAMSSIGANAQATVTSGWASNVGVPGYTYGVPFVPQVVTPQITLSTYSANPVGASNATTGNVAGAANATADNGQGSTGSVVTVPVWYGPGVPEPPQEHMIPPMPMHHMHEGHHGMAEGEHFFDFGSARYEHGTIAERASMAKGEVKKAARTYGNDDVERQNQNNGVVKYHGKTENIG